MNRHNCAAQHFGPWMIEHNWFRQAVESVKSGRWQPAAADKAEDRKIPAATDFLEDEDPAAPATYRVVNGVAIISIEGMMLRYGSSFGGCSTIEVRRSIRAAVQHRMVNQIMLYIDSPGGTVAGTSDLANDVKTAAAAKPLWAYITDLGASAAYWVASQATTIICNQTALIGSIGTYGVLIDSSKADELAGLAYTLISTGPFKGLGADGKVSDALVQDYQREINDLNAHFLAAVSAGRRMSEEQVNGLADGRVHVGQKAVDLRLADVVGSFDAALELLSREQPATQRLAAAVKTTNQPEQEPTMATKPKPTEPKSASHEDQAKHEWSINAGGCRTQFVNEKVYVAYRKADLEGRVKCGSATKAAGDSPFALPAGYENLPEDEFQARIESDWTSGKVNRTGWHNKAAYTGWMSHAYRQTRYNSRRR